MRRMLPVVFALSTEPVYESSGGRSLVLAVDFKHKVVDVQAAIHRFANLRVKIQSPFHVSENEHFLTLCVAQGVSEIRVIALTDARAS